MEFKDDAIESPIVQYNLLKKFIEIRGLRLSINKALRKSPLVINNSRFNIYEIPSKPLNIDIEMANLRFLDLFIYWPATSNGFEFWFKEYCLFLLNCLFLFPNNTNLKKYISDRIMGELEDTPYDMLPLFNKAKFILNKNYACKE